MLKFRRYICILLLAAALFVFKPSPALAGGGFTASCDGIRAEARDHFPEGPAFPTRDYVLIAGCNTTNGSWKISHVDLNEHIVNQFGRLAWLKNGGFRQSTRNCHLYPKNFIKNITVLLCEAADGRGNWPRSSINLDEQIANYDGNLTVLNGF